MRKVILSLSFFNIFQLYADDLVVAAAADLRPLEKPLTEAYNRRSGHRVRFTFGSSGMLAGQIRNGAPYDLFLSANEQYTQELVSAGVLEPDSVRLYALGRVGLYGVKTVAELQNPGIQHIAVPNPKHAPYGVAAEEILRRAGLLETLRPKIVYGENVSQTFEYARTGNAEACLTSWTLVKDAGGVLIPASQHDPVRQSAGIVKGTRHAAAARDFLTFLLSPDGQTVLVRGGLNVP